MNGRRSSREGNAVEICFLTLYSFSHSLPFVSACSLILCCADSLDNYFFYYKFIDVIFLKAFLLAYFFEFGFWFFFLLLIFVEAQK